MRWFGESWGAPICEVQFRVRTPLFEKCVYCQEGIVAGDQGFEIETITARGVPILDPWHLECFMRPIVGSINHQLKRCSCFDPKGTENDPPELSKREAARLAWEYFQNQEQSPK